MATKNSALFQQMKESGNWEDDEAILETIDEMKERVSVGEDPHDVLHEEGLEPDHALDLF